MPRQSIADRPMTDAERQARYRAARAAGTPEIRARRPADHRSRARRWRTSSDHGVHQGRHRRSDAGVDPVRPSPADLWAVGGTLALCREQDRKFAFVVSQASRGAMLTVQAMAGVERFATGSLTADVSGSNSILGPLGDKSALEMSARLGYA